MASQVLKLTPAEESLLNLAPEGAARAALAERGLPSRRVEAWRWSDLRASLRDPLEAAPAPVADVPAAPLDVPGAIVLVFVNGRLVQQPPYVPDHVRITTTTGLARPGDLLASLAAEMAGAALSVGVGKGEPVRFYVRSVNTGGGASATRLHFQLDEGADVTLIETHEGDGPWFANDLTDIDIAPGAALDRIVLCAPHDEGVRVQTSLLALGAGAQFAQSVIGFGGKLARHETHLAHGGHGATARLDAAYLLAARRHFDTTTRVTHGFEGGTTDQLCKGVLAGQGRGVFQGKFRVERPGQRTDAQMGHHALLLSDQSEVRAKPELEIYADDVQCAHGNTAGALDDDAMFYLRQRGLSENAARQLLVEAFCGEVTERIGDEGVRNQLSEKIRDWMAAL